MINFKILQKIFILSCMVLSLFIIAGCTNEDSEETSSANDEGKLKVSVSFDAMKEFVQAVGKDKVAVSVIVPTGSEAHDFEPKGKDLAKLSKADVFVYSGFGMESWADKAIASANNDKLIAVEASKGIEPIKNDEENSEHNAYDPHTWLSLKNAQIEVENIKNALVEADPENKDFYEKNYEEYKTQLNNLYNEYNDKFQQAPRKNFVTGHLSFAYLCRDFNLAQNSVEDTFAEGEPTPQKLTKLVDYCKQNKVKTIFAEEMASPEVSKTLANEIGAKVETIYTMENPEDNLSYLERMKSNLEKIDRSLNEQ